MTSALLFTEQNGRYHKERVQRVTCSEQIGNLPCLHNVGGGKTWGREGKLTLNSRVAIGAAQENFPSIPRVLP
jgi:hypothetical protein